MGVVKTKRVHTTVSLSKAHKKKLGRYCKQQERDQKSVVEYLVSYAIYHDPNVHLPLPKTKKMDPVTQEDFTDLQKLVEGVIIKTLRGFQTPDSSSEEVLKNLNERHAERLRRKDDDYNQVVKQWNESILLNKELKQKLTEQNQGT